MYRNFGENLKRLRQEKMLTQGELAKYFHVAKTTISNYETGYSAPDVVLLTKLADFFEVSIDDLIGRTHHFQEPEEVFYSNTQQIPLFSALNSFDVFDERQHVIKYLPRPDAFFDGYRYFAYEMPDSLLADFGFLQGDILYIRLNAPYQNDDLVLAYFDEEKRVHIGKFFKEDCRIVIVQSNDRRREILIGKQRISKNVKVIGRVAGVFKSFL